jgi:predicted DCC family thiol-disulfide oxidoreductase YuxK
MKREARQKLQKRIAVLAIGPSALRNQGAAGVLQKARAFLSDLDPGRFVVSEECQFKARLNAATRALQQTLPEGAQRWGAARKALNLFLRDVSYSFYLARAYRMARVRQWLEVPLDNSVAKGLKSNPLGASLPRWPGIKHLRPRQSARYQRVAALIADEKGVARVDLDLWYFRANES